jgi:hypothetical protein
MSAVKPLQQQLPAVPVVKLNIYQRINEVRKKATYVQKDKAITGAGGYKAVTHDAVTALLRNHLIDQGIVIVPRLMGSSVVDIGKTQGGTTIIRYSGKYEIDFVNCDDPEDKVTVPGEAHANDHGDKAPGKATSYATKYAMLKLFSIETGEDDEARVEPYESIVKITESEAADLNALIEEVKADKAKFLEYMHLEKVEDMPAKAYKIAVKALEAKRKKPEPQK